MIFHKVLVVTILFSFLGCGKKSSSSSSPTPDLEVTTPIPDPDPVDPSTEKPTLTDKCKDLQKKEVLTGLGMTGEEEIKDFMDKLTAKDITFWEKLKRCSK